MSLNEILNAILIIVTVTYVILTYLMLREIKKENAEQKRPFIHVGIYYQQYTQMVILLIRNTGKTSAYNVRFEIDKDILRFGNEKESIKKESIFQDEINEFPPDHEHIIPLCGLNQVDANKKFNFDESIPDIFTITCFYSFFKMNVAEKHTINLKSHVFDKGMWFIPNALEDICEILRQMPDKLKPPTIHSGNLNR